MLVNKDSLRITSAGKSILRREKEKKSVIIRYQYLISTVFPLFQTQSNQNLVKHKPSHDLICIQIVDENLGRARNFEIFERSRDAGVECPETVARVNLETVDWNQSDIAAVVLLEAGCVMRPVGECLGSSMKSVGGVLTSKLISTYLLHGRVSYGVSWDGADCCWHARKQSWRCKENSVCANLKACCHNLFGIVKVFVALRPVIWEIKSGHVPLLNCLQWRLSDAICVDD